MTIGLISSLTLAAAVLVNADDGSPKTPIATCLLVSRPVGVSNGFIAEATVIGDLRKPVLFLSGSHKDPDPQMRVATKERIYALQMIPQSWEHSYRFDAEGTSGLFSWDYRGKAAMALHIQTADGMYFEHYTGNCRDVW